MFQFLKNAFASLAGTNRPLDRRVRPGLEALDPRNLPAHIHFNAGTLIIDGTNQKDVAKVKTFNQGTRTPQDDLVVATLMHGTQFETKTVPLADMKRIVFDGKFGNDMFTNDTAINSDAFGGPGNDTCIGGSGKDYFVGDDGDDVLYGGYGDDVLLGGTGFDILWGQGGNDYLDGSQDGSPDRLFGGQGADTFVNYATLKDETQATAHGTIEVHISKVLEDSPFDYNARAGDVIQEHLVP